MKMSFKLFYEPNKDGLLKSRAYLVVGLITLIAGVADLLAGPSRVAGGKWAWLVVEIKSLIGFYGYVGLELMLGVAFVWCAIINKPRPTK